MVKIGDLQVDVTNPNAGIDRLRRKYRLLTAQLRGLACRDGLVAQCRIYPVKAAARGGSRMQLGGNLRDALP